MNDVANPEIVYSRKSNKRDNSGIQTLPSMIFFFKNIFYQKQCKYAMNIGVAETRGTLS